MSSVRIINLSTTATYLVPDLSSFGKEIPPLGFQDYDGWMPADVQASARLMADKAAGLIDVAFTFTAAEIASGLLQPPGLIGGDDMQPVAAADLLAVEGTMRKAFALGAGAADDVILYPVNTLPFKFRVLDVTVLISTAAAGASVALRTRAAGAGTLIATASSAATGRIPGVFNATTLVTPAALEGLFLRRLVDSLVAGEVIIRYRRET